MTVESMEVTPSEIVEETETEVEKKDDETIIFEGKGYVI